MELRPQGLDPAHPRVGRAFTWTFALTARFTSRDKEPGCGWATVRAAMVRQAARSR